MNPDAETDKRKELFLKKNCKLEKSNHFFLYGFVDDINKDGLIFRTSQKTSFISWNDILQLIVED